MKPTKEQLDIVSNKVKEMLYVPNERTIALVAITEWEKIREVKNESCLV